MDAPTIFRSQSAAGRTAPRPELLLTDGPSSALPPRRPYPLDDPSVGTDSESSSSDDDDAVPPRRRQAPVTLVAAGFEQMSMSAGVLVARGPAGGNEDSGRGWDDGSDHPRRHRHRHGRRDHHPSLRDHNLPAEESVSPSPDYLRRVAVPSKPVPAKTPLVVVSLDGVLDARLPRHLSGGWTDVLARPYLDPLMDYLLHPSSPWSIVFYTSLSRKKALQTMKSLKLPTGGPEKDERDGVVGVFSHEDMQGWNGGELELKDLDHMWQQLYEEEGIRWGVENTVVLTDRPAFFAKQPSNLVLVPQINYKSNLPSICDQFLLIVIGVLRDLETESNFAYHLSSPVGGYGANKLELWTSSDPECSNLRNSILLNAVRVCAELRIPIVAMTGN